MSTSTWKCGLCNKKNEFDDEICICCKRKKNYGRKSIIKLQQAKPLSFHGVSGSQLRPEQVQDMIQSKTIDVNAVDSCGWTALHCASRNSDECLLLELIKGGANIEAETNTKWRPIHHACEEGNLDICKALISAGASLDERVLDEGLTPLHISVKNGHLDIVELLLKEKVDINKKTMSLRQTALHLAVIENDVECVKILLKDKCEIDPVDSEGVTPYQISKFQQHSMLTTILEANGSSERMDKIQSEILLGVQDDQRRKAKFFCS